MNLATMELVPFSTKALTREGRRVVFVGSVNQCHWWSSGADGTYIFYTNFSGAVGSHGPDIEGPMDIVKIVPRWEPRQGDEVRVIGVMAQFDAHRNTLNHLRSVRSSTTTFIVQELYASREPEFWITTIAVDAPAHVRRYVVHRDQMRLQRRP